MSRVFHTSKRTKPFEIHDTLHSARVARVANASGEGFAALASIYDDRHGASYTAIKHRAWAEKSGVKLYRPLATFALTLAQFSDHGVEGIIASPGALLKFSRGFAQAGIKHRFKHLIAGGSCLSPEASKEIRAGLGDNLFTRYSTSETGPIAIGLAVETAEKNLGCVGRLLDGVRVEIVNGGEIRVRTPYMFEGYLDGPKDSLRDGWFYTGDLGHFEDDMLFFDGRK